MILTLEQLHARCAFWQRILRLQDWDIELLIVRQEKLIGVGDCTTGNSRRATIRLLDPIDFADNEHPPVS